MSGFKEAFTFLYFPLFPSKPPPVNSSKNHFSGKSLYHNPHPPPRPPLVNSQMSELMSPFDYIFVIIYFVLIHSTLETSTDKQNPVDSETTRGVKSQEKGEKLLVVHPGPWKVFTFFKNVVKNERIHAGTARHLVIRTPICLQGWEGQKKDLLNICVCVR